MDDRGALFKNGSKKTDKHPDYTGSITINGVEYNLAAWITTSKSGVTYMSLRKSDKQPPVDKQVDTRSVDASSNTGDIPF